MSPLRDTASVIWSGGPVWARYPAAQALAPGKRARGMDQLEVTVCARACSVRAWRVKRLLRRKGYAIKVIIDVTEDGEPISRLPNADGRGTAPQVFVDGRMVGGLDELKALNRSGDLDRLVHGEI